MSSGERKRRRPNPCRAIPAWGCGMGVVGACVRVQACPGAVTNACARGTGLDAGPERVMAPYPYAHALPDACPK